MKSEIVSLAPFLYQINTSQGGVPKYPVEKAWEHLHPDTRLRIGRDVYIEIISYAEPCRRNAQWFVKANYKRISQKVHPGWSRLYARVVSEGVIRRGDMIDIEDETTARAS